MDSKLPCCEQIIPSNLDQRIAEDTQFLSKEQRLDICKSCDQLLLGTMCNQCKCIVQIKTLLRFQKCPLDKW